MEAEWIRVCGITLGILVLSCVFAWLFVVLFWGRDFANARMFDLFWLPWWAFKWFVRLPLRPIRYFVQERRFRIEFCQPSHRATQDDVNRVLVQRALEYHRADLLERALRINPAARDKRRMAATASLKKAKARFWRAWASARNNGFEVEPSYVVYVTTTKYIDLK